MATNETGEGPATGIDTGATRPGSSPDPGRLARVPGRVAIVTGAAGAIGSATARTLARHGADVVLVDLRPVDAVAKSVAAEGRRSIAVQADLSRQEDVARMVRESLAAFPRIDILANIAGTTSFGPGASLDEAEWDRVQSVNLKSVFFCIQAVIPTMRAQRYGRIVNMGSVIAKNGGNARPWMDPEEQNLSSSVAYGVSKAGVHTLTVFFARELASHGITVNAVAPGPVASPMAQRLPDRLKALIPAGRIGTPEEVADAVAFLAADVSAFISGEVLDVNGAMWSD